MINIAITGPKEFYNRSLVFYQLDYLLNSVASNIQIVEGGTTCLDNLIKDWANSKNIPCIEIAPNWNLFGSGAEMIRNQEMIRESQGLVVFYDGSFELETILESALSKGIEVHVVDIFYNSRTYGKAFQLIQKEKGGNYDEQEFNF